MRRVSGSLAQTERDPGWPTATLRELSIKGSLLDPAKNPTKDFEYIDVSSVSSDRLAIVSTTRVRGAAAPSRARKLVGQGDVIFATIRPTLRRVALVPQTLDGQLASTAFCVIRANPEVADSRFLYYTTITPDFVQRVGALERGASYPAVTEANVLDQEVSVPPLAEQRAIAGVLSRLQARVEVQDPIVASLRELKVATMARLFRRGLRGESLKTTKIGEIPESWEVVRVGSVADPASGGTPSKSRPEWWLGTIPWASPKDMKAFRLQDAEDHISAEALEAGSRLVPRGTVFVVTRGMILAKDVPVAIADVPMAFNQDMRALRPTGAIDPDFLLYALLSRKGALTTSIGTTAHGTRSLGSAALENLLIPKPDSEEQHAIVQILSDLDRRGVVAEHMRGSLRSLFHELLQSMTTGRLRIRHAS